MPFTAGKPPRSPHDWLCKFCVTSSGNPYRNNGFRRECHRCHLEKGEAFKARSEKRERPAKSTKESARVATLEKELERYRQAEKKSDESAQQETDAPSKAAYKMAIKALGHLQTAGLFQTITRRSSRSKQSWTRQKRPVTSPCSSARGFEQARTRSPCMKETSKRPTIVWKRLSKASWLPRRAWTRTEPRLKTSRRRCRRDGTSCNIYTDKLQPKRPMERGHIAGNHVPSRNYQAPAPRGKGQPEKGCGSL